MARIVLFPGAWLLSVVPVCNAGVWWGSVAVLIVGLVTYGLASIRRPKQSVLRGFTVHLLFVALIMVGSVELPAAYGALSYSSIGDAPDGIAEECKRADAAPIPDRHGEVAVVRRRHCLISFPEDGTDEYFVFVHDAQQANSEANLVFRYEDGDDKGPAPSVSWAREGTLNVVVPRPIYAITLRRGTVDGRIVNYTTGSVGCNGAWERMMSAILWSSCR